MIIDLPNTTTSEITRALIESRDAAAAASGRVLTLLVVAGPQDDLEDIIATTATVSHEHPARVLVMVEDPDCGNADRCDPILNATVRVGGDAGASEMVIMTIQGEIARHLEHVVTPLLLPDTPIVTWWPSAAPQNPAEHPLGKIAQRRITDSLHDGPMDALYVRKHHYTSGDSDLAWSRITPWRGIVASAFDQFKAEDLQSVTVYGATIDPSVDIAAGWLAARLPQVRVTRVIDSPAEGDGFMVANVEFSTTEDTLRVRVEDAHTISVEVPGRPAALVALSRRPDADCLAEELRHLDPDGAYEAALTGLNKVHFPEG